MATRKLTAKQKWEALKEFIEKEQEWNKTQEKKYHEEGDEKMEFGYWSRSWQVDQIIEKMKEITNYVKLPWEE